MRQPPKRQRHRQARERERRMNPPHEKGIGCERENHVQALQQHAVHEQPRVLHVAGDAVEYGVGTVEVEEAEAQALELGVDLRAQGRHDFALGEAGGDHVIGVIEHCANQRLRHDGQRQDGDHSQRGPTRRRLPAERIDRHRHGRIQRVADDVNHQAEQLEAGDAQQQQRQAQDRRPNAIGPKPPGQRQQAAHQYSRGISLVVEGVVVGRRHLWPRQDAGGARHFRMKNHPSDPSMGRHVGLRKTSQTPNAVLTRPVLLVFSHAPVFAPETNF